MMIELTVDEFQRVAPLFDAYHGLRPAIYSVLEGRQAGRVFVDRADRPRAALMWSDAFYLAGEARSATIRAGLRSLLDSPARRTEYNLIFAVPGRWQGALSQLLAPLGGEPLVRSIYALDVAAFRALPERPLPRGYSLQPLDERTAAQAGGMPELWGSVARFMAEGVGYCVLHGEAFASSSQTVFVGDGRAEIGVGTREPYRRQGLGRAAARATITACLERGLTPEWGCMYNPISGAMAASLGFVPRPDLPFYLVRPREPLKV